MISSVEEHIESFALAHDCASGESTRRHRGARGLAKLLYTYSMAPTEAPVKSLVARAHPARSIPAISAPRAADVPRAAIARRPACVALMAKVPRLAKPAPAAAASRPNLRPRHRAGLCARQSARQRPRLAFSDSTWTRCARICELTDADDMSCLARTCKLLRKLADERRGTWKGSDGLVWSRTPLMRSASLLRFAWNPRGFE
jgi:hypothetical protein